MDDSGGSKCRYIDIGANLTDPVFGGVYHSKAKHPDDLANVLKRSQDLGVQKIIITGGTLSESKRALDLAGTSEQLYATVGCHPTRCLEFEQTDGMTSDAYLAALLKLIEEGRPKVAAVGECGLDFDRLQFCPKEEQLRYFELQFALSDATGLPMFLHCRNAGKEMIEILTRNRHRFRGAVVHSFDGSEEEARQFVDLGLHIGINGCSLKTEDNLKTLKSIPADRLLAETDAPWCEIKPAHASFRFSKTKFAEVKAEKWSVDQLVKGRNEPCRIVQVVEVMAAVRGDDFRTLANTIYDNTVRLFDLDKK